MAIITMPDTKVFPPPLGTHYKTVQNKNEEYRETAKLPSGFLKLKKRCQWRKLFSTFSRLYILEKPMEKGALYSNEETNSRSVACCVHN